MADKKKRNKIKVGSFITPIGVASYPHLVAPDTKWKPEGEYRCPLIYDEAGADILRGKLQPLLDKGFEELKKEHFGDTPNAVKAKRMGKEALPIKALEDEEGNETGQYRISPKKLASGTKKDGTPWKAKAPTVFDSKGKKLLPVPSVWGGSKLKADVDVFAYYAAKDNVVGLTLELVGVQVIELVSGGGERESAFGEVEGGYVAEERESFGDTDDTDDEDTDEGSADF